MKRLFSVLTIGLLLTLLAACAAPAPTATTAPVQPTAAPAQATSAPAQPTAAAATKAPSASGPIKIGVMAPQTGTLAASGKDMIDAWNLYWNNNPTTIAGREVQFFVEDDAGNPDTALTKARLLVEQRGVHILVGNLVASTGLAVAEYAKGNGIPYFIPIVSADDLTQRTRIPNVVRLAGWTSSQTTHPAGEWAYKQGYKTAVTVAQDYAFGHETIGGFVQTFTESGGKILGQIWNPIGAPDFSAYIAQIQSLNPDLVFVEETGADCGRFIKQWSDFGLKGKIALLGNETLVDQSLLRGMGNEADGIISVGKFAEGRDAPETQNFVDNYDKAYKLIPGYYAVNMYSAALMLAAAIDKAGGKVEDRTGFINIIRSISLDKTPLGPVKIDDYGNPILNVYLRKVAKRPDGRLWNTVTFTWPNVSQFWTYDIASYLKQPVYSRDYQPGANATDPLKK
jgi:branched-chain amino acid transport system substrate-binding protein